MSKKFMEICIGVFFLALSSFFVGGTLISRDLTEVFLNKPKFQPFDLIDENWEHGISRKIPGLFVAFTKKAGTEILVGRKIRFHNGVERNITVVDHNSRYLNITLDGKLLSPEEYGFPRSFEIID